MYSFSTEGLVLKRKNFGEADRIVTIFTRNRGKVPAVAKGIRKISSRRAGNLELLNHVKVYLSHSSKMPILTEASSLNTFQNLKGDLSKLSLSYLILELVDKFFDVEQENHKIFDLLVESLEAIDNADNFEKAKLFSFGFQIKLLKEVGYLPEMFKCVRCSGALKPKNNFLSPNLGGLIDELCAKDSIFSKAVSERAIKALRFLENESIDIIDRLYISKKISSEVAEILNFYTIFFLEKDLQSAKFALQVEKVIAEG